MRLTDALKLKKGTKLIAKDSWVAPGQFTKGKTYLMEFDARLIYQGKGMFLTSTFPSIPNDEPCNALLPIVDDRGELIVASYIMFSVSK